MSQMHKAMSISEFMALDITWVVCHGRLLTNLSL